MEEVWLMGNRLEIHLAAETHTFIVDHPPPAFRLTPHRHRDHDETIHVVEGTYELVLEGRTRQLGPGDTVHVPRGSAHDIRNTGETVGRRVLVFTPGGLERFFLAAGTRDPQVSRPPQELLALCAEVGWELL